MMRGLTCGGIASALVLTCLAVTPAAVAAAPAAPDCESLLAEPAPVAEVVDDLTATEEREVAAVNDVSLTELRELAEDETLWADQCGQAFYVEPTQVSRAAGAAAAAVPALSAFAAGDGPAGSLADTFALSSNPGAERTIYLDFDGDTITDTVWNAVVDLSVFDAAPFSMDDQVGTDFSDAELREIQTAYLVVAEDYAPYDVNVTTADPGPAALERTSLDDDSFGTRVIITGSGPVWGSSSCPDGCGGVAYLEVFGDASGATYQPAWVFTDGASSFGRFLAQAVSHEVGHTVGLRHDGTVAHDGVASAEYSEGSGVWAPIMGASYDGPVSQWSSGEYPYANRHEDDTAILAGVLGRRSDDYGDATPTAEPLPAEPVARDGLITTRGDVDAFTVTTDEPFLVSAMPTALQPNLDVGLAVRNLTTGEVVANVNPAVVDHDSYADGLDAIALVRTGPTSTYLITVDGAGYGNPAAAGHYSDYGSQGAYRLLVTPQVPDPPIEVADQRFQATAQSAFSGRLLAEGGVGSYTFAPVSAPTWLRVGQAGQLSGVPTSPGITTFQVRGFSGNAAVGRFTVTIAVAPAPLRMLVAPRATRKVARAGKTLAVSAGRWSAGATVRYQWFTGARAVKGATKPTLKLTSRMRGKKPHVRITVTAPGQRAIVRTVSFAKVR